MFPHDNIFKIYYQIGRALPFEVRRYPRGVETPYYNSQSVLVTKIAPRKEYGNAWGYYLKNGERADSYWCEKDTIEPQPIPCCGCGGWILVKVIGQPTQEQKLNEANKIMVATDKITFGKYKGKTIAEIKDIDLSYLQWAEKTISGFRINWDSFK